MATPTGSKKTLLIKDSGGNLRLIDVIQTAPGNFVTATGHSIEIASVPGLGLVKTITPTAPADKGQIRPTQHSIVSAQSGKTFSQATQKIRTSNVATPNTIINGPHGHRVLAIPFQGGEGLSQIRTLNAGPVSNAQVGPPTTAIIQQRQAPIVGLSAPVQRGIGLTQTRVINAGTTTAFSSQVGAPTTAIIQQRQAPMVVGSAPAIQVIQAGNQRLLLTGTPNGPQLVTEASVGAHQTIAPILTADPNVPGVSRQQAVAANLGPTLNFNQHFIPPTLDHARPMHSVEIPSDDCSDSEPRRGGRGLRYISMRVCEIVRTKGITTYSEVADELVQELALPIAASTSTDMHLKEKGIQRRIYDAVNILEALEMISKENREIKWLGPPTNSMIECAALENDRQKRIERVNKKTQHLHKLIIEQVAFKSLVEKNKEREKENGPPPPHSSVRLPFLIVNTAKDTVIDCLYSNDKMEIILEFDGLFDVHEDVEVLKRLGLALGLDKGECTDKDVAKAKSFLPKALRMYIDELRNNNEDWRAEFCNALEQTCNGDEIRDDTAVYQEMPGSSDMSLSGLDTTGDLTGATISADDLKYLDIFTSLETLLNLPS